MPISSIDCCTSEHWSEVKCIFEDTMESIEEYNFITSIVSDADEVGIIQKRKIQNVYSSDIVICDVSGKNPNVMFEFGLRLAFDKPTIIIKDDKTDYSIDTGVMLNLQYSRYLRFTRIIVSKSKLKYMRIATLEEKKKNPKHSTFLKSTGNFKVTTLKNKK